MAASFTTTPVAGGRVLIEGTDSKGVEGTAILHSTPWQQVLDYQHKRAAQESFDATVEEFFAPLLAAAEQMEGDSKFDPTVVTVNEGAVRVDGEEPIVVRLDADGVILRAVASKAYDQLRWVNGELVLLLP